MENRSCGDLVKAWYEVKQKLAEAFALAREVLEGATRELAECEKRLNESFISVDGTLEKLGIDPKKTQEHG